MPTYGMKSCRQTVRNFPPEYADETNDTLPAVGPIV
jgi:hypothetical protein